MFDLWVGKIPWRRKWHLTPVLLPGESHGQKSLAGHSQWGGKGQAGLSDFTFTVSVIPSRLFSRISERKCIDFCEVHSVPRVTTHLENKTQEM